MKKISRKRLQQTALVCYGLCAAMWSARFVFFVANNAYQGDIAQFILDGSVALVWITNVVLNVMWNRPQKDD